MANSFGLVILAAGQGTRLKIDRPKALAPVMGRALIDYSIEALEGLMQLEKGNGKIGIVVGHMREKVENYIQESYGEKNYSFAIQEKQLGTADAVKAYFKGCSWANEMEYTVIMCADTPLITSNDLQRLCNEIKTKNLDGVVATFLESNPKGYGRIIRSKNSVGLKIVEEKDASEEERKINEVNSGLYILKTSFVLKHLYTLNNKNKSGEFYLTDLFQDSFNVAPVLFEDSSMFLGVNNLEQLETAQKLLNIRKIRLLQSQGVRFIDSSSVIVEEKVEIGTGSVINPGVHLWGKTKIAENVHIGPGVVIKDSNIEGPLEILAYSYIEESTIRKGASVGPFARLRPGTDIGEKAKVGNFVEIKKSKLDRGAKVSHLSYVGDAEIGEESNIGCGFITCNYDGAKKHKTKIGKRTFIGSDSQTVAPVEIGDDCFVACSTTITNNMESGSFAISRNKQVTKEGMASRFIKKK